MPPSKSSISRSLTYISAFFNAEETRSYKASDLNRVLQRNRLDWKILKSITVPKFIKYLLAETPMKCIVLDFPNRPETRYFWGNVSSYEIGLSVSPNGYLSHHSAMIVHGLAPDSSAKNLVYVNVEQQAKSRPDSSMSQETINAAFGRSPRMTKRLATYERDTFCLLNGMNTGNLGVIRMPLPDKTVVRVTNLERTLIDIAVRPFHSGGISSVLEAYQKSRGRVKVETIVRLLRKLDYVYPYHQSIGFLLERSGFSPAETKPLKSFGLDFDFYIEYQIKDVDYSSEWRLYYPKGSSGTSQRTDGT